MIGKPRKKPAKTVDARAILAEADAELAARREHVTTLRTRRAEVLAEHGAITAAISAEQYTAGREGRDAEGIAEQRDRLATLEQESHDLARTAEGAERGVKDAEEARSRVLLEHFPAFAAQLDEAEHALLNRRAEIESMVAQQQADESQHRAQWDELLRTVPFLPDGVSFQPKETVGVQHSPGHTPAPPLHPYARPDDPNDRLLAGYPLDQSWPKWLQDTWRKTIQPADAPPPIWHSPAAFDAA